MKDSLEFGWGEADITPQAETVELAGQYYQRVARGHHSPLAVVVLLLRQEETCIVMVSLDTVGIPLDYCQRLRKTLVRKVPELAGAQIMFNATHTHSAPALKPSRSWWEKHPRALSVEDYQVQVEKAVVEAVVEAWRDRQPGGVSAVMEAARTGHCRRAVYTGGQAEMYGRTDRPVFLGMEGGEDSGVELLYLFNAANKPVGVMINVPCPSQVMEAAYLVSSDYMGKLREKLKLEFGAEFRTLCQVGAAGCQSPRDLTRREQEQAVFWRQSGVDILAERLLTAVRRGLTRSVEAIDFQPRLAGLEIDLALPKRRVSYQDYKNARQELRRLEEKQDSLSAYEDFCRQVKDNEQAPDWVPPYDDKLHHFVLMRNQDAVVRRYREQSDEPDFQMLLQVARIGRVALASNPFELFLEYGQRIKARSPADQTFVVQLANGSGGYLPSPRAESLGGYGGLVINGQVGADGGALFVDRTVETINRLWN